MSESVTLFLTETRAFEAALKEQTKRVMEGCLGCSLRVLPATMMAADRSVDQGYKVLMVPKRNIMGRTETPYYL